MEKNNIRFQKKYKEIQENEVRYEAINCENADYLIIAFGSSARICQKTIETAAKEGVKVGLLRPITLWPFPTEAIAQMAKNVKGILVMELNAGQMIEDVQLAVKCSLPVEHYGRLGGIVPDPDEVWEAMKVKLQISSDSNCAVESSAGESISKEQINEVISNLNQMVP